MDFSYIKKDISVMYNESKKDLLIDDFVHHEDGIYYVSAFEDCIDDISNSSYTQYQLAYDNEGCIGDPIIIERAKSPFVDKHVSIDNEGEFIELHIYEYPMKYGKSFMVEGTSHETIDGYIHTDHYTLYFDNPSCSGDPIKFEFDYTSY